MRSRSEPDAHETLEALLVSASGLEAASLGARLEWLERLALAAGEAELGEDGPRAVLDLKAALGAIVAYARGGQDPRELEGLVILVGALISRALDTLFRALARVHRALAASGLHAKDCRELAAVFEELGAAVRRGTPPSRATIARWEAIRARA